MRYLALVIIILSSSCNLLPDPVEAVSRSNPNSQPKDKEEEEEDPFANQLFIDDLKGDDSTYMVLVAYGKMSSLPKQGRGRAKILVDSYSSKKDYNTSARMQGMDGLLLYNSLADSTYILQLPEGKKLWSATFWNNGNIHKGTDYIFYQVIEEDYNNDKELNSQDGLRPYISQIDGSGFKPILPLYERVISEEYVEQTKKMLYKTYIDKDTSNTLTAADDMFLRVVDMKNPDIGVMLLSNDSIKQ